MDLQTRLAQGESVTVDLNEMMLDVIEEAE